MRLERELELAAPASRAWARLAATDALARGFSGVALLGCRGTLRPLDVDEDERVVTAGFVGRQEDGPGIAAGTVELRLLESNGSARVLLGADLELRGRRAPAAELRQAGERLLDELAERLAQRVLADADADGEPREAAARRQRRALAVALPLALLVLARLLARRRGRGYVVISYRW